MSLTLKLCYAVSNHDCLLRTLRSLPTRFAPIYFSTNERVQDKSNRLDNEGKFAELMTRSKRFGFTLLGEKISFHLSPTTFRDKDNVPTHGYLFVEVKKGFKHLRRIGELFSSLLEVEGIDFGYMCEHDEFIHRNRLVKNWAQSQSGPSSTEFVIGIDFRRYVPGLYWRTAFSEEYISHIRINIEELRSISSDVEVIGQKPDKKIYIFTFYENSNDWREYEVRLDKFIADHESFFSLLRLREQIDYASSEDELRKVVSDYI